MTRRSISILLGVSALIAAGLVWVSISVIGGPAEDEATAPLPALERTTRDSDLPLAPLPGPGPTLPVDDTTTTRTAVSESYGEGAALPRADLELRDSLWVEGRVVVPPGTPPDEFVEVVAIGNAQETRPLHRSPIAADGSFRVAFAPGTVFGRLDLEAKYLYLEEELTVSVAPPQSDLLLTPRLGGRIRARIVLSPAVVPLRPVIVGSWGRAQRPGGEFARHGRVDERLELDLPGIEPGPDYEVRVSAPGCCSVPHRALLVEAGRVTSVDLELELGATVSGWVFGPNGTTKSGTLVVARPLGGLESDTRSDELRRVFSAPSGRFELSGLTAGEWELTASEIGFAKSLPYRVQLSAGGSVEDVRLELRRPGGIAGRVLGVDGKPAVYAVVRVFSDQPGEVLLARTEFLAGRSMTTDKAGDFEIENLMPGTYRIEVDWSDPANGGEACRSAIPLAEGVRVEGVVIRIERPGRIEGRVMDPDGRPAFEARVVLKDAATGIARPQAAHTEESGEFSFERVPPGEFVVEVRGEEPARFGEARIGVRAGEAVRAEISLQAGTLLTVYLEGFGEDSRAVTVSIRDEKGVGASPRSSGEPADEELAIRFGPLWPGKYVVEATGGGKRASQSVTLSGQAAESIRLRASD
ncbi:MAG: carboxypeptidase regulatory-like domain-containing protein [Planctomycetota bacterium]